MVSDDHGNGDCRNTHPSIALSIFRTLRDFDRLLPLECCSVHMFTRWEHYSIYCMAGNLGVDVEASGSKSLPRGDANGIGDNRDDDCVYCSSTLTWILDICPGLVLD